MKTVTHLTLLAFLVIAFASCRGKENKVSSIEVKHYGALRTLMSGNIEPVISLDTLSEKKYLYALGAVDHLKGEIQIFDSQPSNSFVVDSSLQIRDSYSVKAAMLVYVEVKEWDSYKVENNTTKEELEEKIFEVAKRSGIDTEKPFPFLLEGSVASLDWHVINWKDGDTIHSHAKHKASGLNGTLLNEKVQIIGFYSTKHKSVFTHHTTNMHMHFKTKDNSVAGHIDDVTLNQTVTLKLPKQ